MGSWGFGNFDSDAACDWYRGVLGQSMIQKIEAGISEPVLLEPDESECEQVIAAIATLTGLNRHVFPILPPAEEVIAWRDAILAAWDAFEGEGYANRRKVVVKTLAAAIRQAKSNEL